MTEQKDFKIFLRQLAEKNFEEKRGGGQEERIAFLKSWLRDALGEGFDAGMLCVELGTAPTKAWNDLLIEKGY